MQQVHTTHLIDSWYASMLQHIMAHGTYKQDRTGTGTQGVHGASVTFDLGMGAPVLGLKKTAWLTAVRELQVMLSGRCDNVSAFHEKNVHVWDDWADADGNLGPIYGMMWRHWPTPSDPIDQLAMMLRTLRDDPFSRRNIVEGWNPAVLPLAGHKPQDQAGFGRQALPPCHKNWQVLIRELDGHYYLDLIMYQRSADIFLGVPFNIAQYAWLTEILAGWASSDTNCPKLPGEVYPGLLTVHYGDLHLYNDHRVQAQEVIRRWTSGELPAENSPYWIKAGIALTQQTEPWDLEWNAQDLACYEPLPHLVGQPSV